MTEVQQVRDDASQDRLAGVLLGTAVGDSIGLPAEGLSRRRRQRLLPGPWRHRFLRGHGMIRDDTEPALMVAQSLLAHPDDAAAFERDLARRLRWWFLGLPAGVGLATARACIKLWLGFSPKRSGVYSAGNGPAMRSALLGACFCDDEDAIGRFVTASTGLTQTQQKTDGGAQGPVRALWPAVLPRNLLFLFVVLLHGFRRLAPPY